MTGVLRFLHRARKAMLDQRFASGIVDKKLQKIAINGLVSSDFDRP
jgi:hypothetical protein